MGGRRTSPRQVRASLAQRPEGETACMESWAGGDGWACRLPGAVVAMKPFWGASPMGPYNKNETGAAAGRFEQVRRSAARPSIGWKNGGH